MVDGKTPAHSTAIVATERPVRFGKAVVGHLGRRNSAEWSDADSRGWILFDMGRADAWCAGDGLHLEVAGDPADLDRLEDVVGRHLVRFGDNSHEALHVRWTRASGDPGSEQHGTGEPAPPPGEAP